MKAFIYTLILAAILVVAVVYLQRIPDRKTERETDIATRESARPAPEIPVESKPGEVPPISVRSAPALRTTMDSDDLAGTNNAALFETGEEMLSLWHVPEAIEVFETLLEREPGNLKALLRLAESYADPTVDAERKVMERLSAARAISVQEGDTLWVDALRLLYVERNPAQAVDRLQQIVERDPQDGPARRLLCEAYLDDANTTEAQSQLEELLDSDRTLGRERELMVRCKAMRGEFKDAEQIARDLTTLYPEEPYPHVLLSVVMLVTGQIRSAVESCDAALKLDNRYVPAIAARAQLHVAQGMREAARVNFEKLLLFDDPVLQTVGLEGMAQIDFMSGRFDEGTDGMNEAIRLAMSEGSTRRGLVYALRLVDYLCELGRFDVADGVLNRWVESHGDIPNNLGRLRVLIAAANPRDVRGTLDQVLGDKDWRLWMHRLDIDPVSYQALTFISEKRFGPALQALHDSDLGGMVGTARLYLRGVALFHQGEAERAVTALRWSRFRMNSMLFPYGADPVLRVQSIFFLGEAELARGQSDAARESYDGFLKHWGNAEWELEAVSRAREKFKVLSPARDS